MSMLITSQDMLSLLVAVFATIFSIRMLIPYAYRLGLISKPGEHRQHSYDTPVLGGIGMFIGFLLALIVLPIPMQGMRALVFCLAIVFFIGLLDDIKNLHPSYRFAVQILAGLLAVWWGNVSLQDLGHLLSPELLTLGVFSLPLTVFCFVGVINAINMADGLDGQAACLVLVTCVFLGLALWQGGHYHDLRVIILLCVVVTTYLWFNIPLPSRKQAIIFMGDSGSMLLGLLLAWFLVKVSQGQTRAISPVTAIWFLALPLMDAVSVMLRRMIQGTSPFASDRTHFHHLLLALGLTNGQAVLLLATLAVALAGVGQIGMAYEIAESRLLYLFLGLFATYFFGNWLLLKRLEGDIKQ